MGIVSEKGTGPLVEIKKKLNAKEFQEVFENSILPYLKENRLGGRYIIADGDTAHVCASTMSYFRKKKIKLFRIPPSSPELNIIETIRAHWQKNVRSCIANGGNFRSSCFSGTK